MRRRGQGCECPKNQFFFCIEDRMMSTGVSEVFLMEYLDAFIFIFIVFI